MKNRIISLLTALLMLFAAFPLVPGVFAAGPAAENTMATAQSETGEASVLLLAEPKYFIDAYYIAFCGKYFVNKNYKNGYDALVDCYGNVVWETKQSKISLGMVNSQGFITCGVGGKGQIFNVRGEQLSDGKYSLSNALLWRDLVTGKREWMCAQAYSVGTSKPVGYQLVSLWGECMFAEGFDPHGYIYDGMIVYKSGGKWGLRKLFDKDLIACSYDRLYQISKDRLVGIKNGKGYVLNTAGKTVKALGAVEDLEPVHNRNRALIKKNGMWGVVDGAGNVTVSFAYERLEFNYSESEDGTTYIGKQNDNMYWIGEGTDGLRVFLCDAQTMQYKGASAIAFGDNAYLLGRPGIGRTLVDKNGNALLSETYDSGEIARQNDHLVYLQKNASGSNSPAHFAVYREDLSCVMEGEGWAQILSDCIAVNTDNTVRIYSIDGVLLKTIKQATVYSYGECLALYRDGKYAVVDHKGNICTKFIYDMPYASGVDRLISMKKGDSYYLLNENGKQVLDYPIEDAWLFSNEDNPEHYAAFKYKGKFGFIQYAENKQANPFADVQESDPYYSAVQWAVYHKPYQVTAGIDKTHFGPDKTVTRAQAMTFFWAAQNRPKFKKASTQFVDVKKTDWFYKSVMWAVENGVTAGTDATHFSPNKTCNRGEILAFLYAALRKPKVKINNPYKDVSNQWYKKAALWAYENGIERGEKGRFNASTACTRASTVTYLYRFLERKDLVE